MFIYNFIFKYCINKYKIMNNYLANGKSGFLKDKDKTKFKDDDWETHVDILKDIKPYIPSGVIWDPFYCSGYVTKEWKKLGIICINKKKMDLYGDLHKNFHVLYQILHFQKRRNV